MQNNYYGNKEEGENISKECLVRGNISLPDNKKKQVSHYTEKKAK